MLTVVRRGGATREKPPEVVRGQVSRLPWVWDGLCFAVPFNDSVQDTSRDLVFNAAPSTVSGLAWARDNRGNPAATLSDTSYIEYAHTPMHTKPSTEITFCVRLRRAGTVDVAGGIFCYSNYSDLASGPWESWNLQGSDSADNSLTVSMLFTSGPMQMDTTYILPTTTWLSAFVRWRSGAAVKVDILGERGETLYGNISATYGGTISYGPGTDPVRLNANANLAKNFNGDYSQALLWSRYLTDTEVQALVADPYGWYSPRRETIGVSSPYPLYGGQSFMREVSSG